MSIFHRLRQFYVKNVTGPTLNSPSFFVKRQDYSQVQDNPPIYQSQSLDAPSVDTSTKSLDQKRFNPSTDSYSGIHNYD